MTNWLAFPNIGAPSPQDPNRHLNYAVSDTFIERNASNHRNTPILQMWTHVLGQLPPINNISKVSNSGLVPTLQTLNDAVACFEGINRPHDNENNGQSVLVYILTPTVSIQFEPNMVCQARSIEVPPMTVLTVQVRPAASLQAVDQGINGIVTRLEFVLADEADPRLPKAFGTRYTRMFWRR